MLYLSLYVKKHRQEYYDLLQRVRLEGDWESWLTFFMSGVKETADCAVQTAHILVQMFQKDRERIGSIGRLAGSALRVYQMLQQHAVISIGRASREAGLSIPTVTDFLNALIKLGITRELTGQQRRRLC